MRERSSRTRIYAPIWRDEESIAFAARIDQLHAAIEAQQVLRPALFATKWDVKASVKWNRCAWPSGAVNGTLGTWCRLRRDFRNFRPDRIARIDEAGEVFDSPPDRNLTSYLQAMRGYYAGLE